MGSDVFCAKLTKHGRVKLARFCPDYYGGLLERERALMKRFAVKEMTFTKYFREMESLDQEVLRHYLEHVPIEEEGE